MSLQSLPDEMIQMIFLELNDLNEMLKCRLVSRRCKQVVDEIRLTGSLTVHLQNSTCAQPYELTEHLISPTSCKFKTKKENFLNRKLIRSMISGVKKLAISYSCLSKQFQANINRLKQLDHLQLGVIYNSLEKSSNPLTVRFNRIKTFAILERCYSSIVLKAPQLTRLVLLSSYSDPTLKLVNTNKLNRLVLSGDRHNALSGYSKDQIEYMYFHRNPYNSSVIPAIVAQYPALRKLHIQETSKMVLCEILKQMKIARNLSLKIYMAGWPIDDLEEVEQLFGDQDYRVQTMPVSQIVKNFERIYLIDWIKLVNYSELIGASDRLSVDAFFTKFISIQQVTVDDTVDSEANFIEFLTKCKLLKELTITNSPFNQAFYDNLHTYCASLQVLKIELEHQINLEFLIEHIKLEQFVINSELDFAFIDRLIQLKPTRDFRFKQKGIWVQLYSNLYNFQFKFKDHSFSYSTSSKNLSIVTAFKDLLNQIETIEK